MSVAFRRDSDEEHLEPKFELPIPAGPNLVTTRGLRLIEQRVAALRRDVEAPHDEAAMASLMRDLRYWEARQVSAEVAAPASGDKVEFETQVRVRLNGTARTFQIVGDDEADPSEGAISFKAPLSGAMLGAQAGDALPFGGADDAIEILAIEVLDG